MTRDFEDKSVEELREIRDFYAEELGWGGNVSRVEAELAARGEPSDPDSEVVDEEVATLKEKLEWFRQQGWDSNAEKVAEELSRRDELDTSDELSGSTDDELTHVAELVYEGP